MIRPRAKPSRPAITVKLLIYPSGRTISPEGRCSPEFPRQAVNVTESAAANGKFAALFFKIFKYLALF